MIGPSRLRATGGDFFKTPRFGYNSFRPRKENWQVAAEKLIRHPSVRMELDRFRALGGTVKIQENTIVLCPNNIVPREIAEMFRLRIKTLDKNNLLSVEISE